MLSLVCVCACATVTKNPSITYTLLQNSIRAVYLVELFPMVPDIMTFPHPILNHKSQKMASVFPKIIDKNSAANTNFIFSEWFKWAYGVTILLGAVGFNNVDGRGCFGGWGICIFSVEMARILRECHFLLGRLVNLTALSIYNLLFRDRRGQLINFGTLPDIIYGGRLN